MKYFKNTELANLYHVSEKSVRNWIQAALEGKLELTLHRQGEKFFVANISKNTPIIESLVAKGKKYKNTRGLKSIRPKDKFYTLYSPKQILDIISSIDTYREVPLQYSYFNSGAQRWDEYTKHLLEENTPNSLSNTHELLELNDEYIDSLLEGFTAVNIIDIGVGNGMPVKELVKKFLEKKILKRYIALDISQELLNIAETNFSDWFGNEVAFEGYTRDINYERFDDLLVAESFGEPDQKIANLVLFLGGTISNFRQPNHPLTTIHDSMDKNDILIFTKKLDSQRSRRYFDFTGSTSLAIDLVLNLLNIEKSFYTVEQFFDEKTMSRQVRAKFDISVSIVFELEGGKRTIDINKDDSLLLLRVQHQNTMDTLKQFDEVGFDLMQVSRSKDQDYLLLLSKVQQVFHK